MAETNKLNARTVQQLSKPGLHSDGNGLYLKITKTGTKSWIFRYRLNGKLKDMGLGGYPEISLADARKKTLTARQERTEGNDPLAIKRETRASKAKNDLMTFDKASALYIQAHENEWKNPKHRQQWANTLTQYAYPFIGNKPVADITLNDVLSVLQPIWNEKNETATRVRGRIERILDWAKVQGYRTAENPARWKGNLDHLLAKPSKIQTVKHHTALSYIDAPIFWKRLKTQAGMGAMALQFTVLTATRTTETLEAAWDEIEGDIWVIPASRMKAGREHHVPLSKQGLALLKELPQDSAYIFPGAKGKPLSNMGMAMVLRRMKYEVTVHGFRSTFRDWAEETTSHSHNVCEMALAHTITNEAEAAYRRGKLLDKRRLLMQDWADFLESNSSKKLS